MASRIAGVAIRRVATCTSASPRICARITKPRTANVVTLIPTAVPAGPPPMNIKMLVISHDSSVKAPMSIVLNPAVRALTDMNDAASSFVEGLKSPSVRWFVHSKRRNAAVPPTRSRRLITTTMRVWTVHVRGVRHLEQFEHDWEPEAADDDREHDRGTEHPVANEADEIVAVQRIAGVVVRSDRSEDARTTRPRRRVRCR